MTTNQDAPLALVIGATGGVGGAVADRLLAAGWRVRALHRNPETARRTCELTGLEWVTGDAMIEADVVAAAAGASLVMHGANPPDYRNWAGLQTPMLSNSIRAAKATGARIIFPGTVYNFGPDAFPSLREDSAQRPATRKGKIRVEMETMLAHAAQDGVKVLIVRAGDFFGPRPSASSWLGRGLVKPGAPISSVTYPGPLSVDHAWGYLPDVAQTMVRLALLADLGDFEVFHMRGQVLNGEALVTKLEWVAGRKLAVARLPWFAIRGLAPFNETFREMLEMRYLWETPVLLDNSRLIARLGEEPHTPIEEALRLALEGLGVIPQRAVAIAA